MDFKTHSDEGETKSFKKLDDAFIYSEEHEDVESISFVLPTNEKVALSRSLDGWEYDPLDSELGLTDLEAEVLAFCSKEGEGMAPEEYWETMDDLHDRGLLVRNEPKSNADVEYLDPTNRGLRALQRR